MDIRLNGCAHYMERDGCSRSRAVDRKSRIVTVAPCALCTLFMAER